MTGAIITHLSALMLGSLVGSVAMAIMAARSYERGWSDGRREFRSELGIVPDIGPHGQVMEGGHGCG